MGPFRDDLGKLPDGRVRLDLWNDGPDSVDVLIKAKRAISDLK